MPEITIALFHAGDMGSGFGAALAARGQKVLCALQGRSAATRARAQKAGLVDAETVASAVRQSTVVLSICPPHGALALAREVAGAGFKGLYIDANAISPATSRKIAEVLAGATYVDGAILGAPPTPDKAGRVLLNGPKAAEAARLFDGSYIKASVLEGPLGAASALKMCYAAWTKGTWLMLSSIYAAAEHEGVAQALRDEWARTHPDLIKQLGAPSLNPAKAWRWLSEMQEMAIAFESAGQPAGYAQAGEEICRRLERYKEDATRPSIEKVTPAVRSK
jgi:3-hydroxyisobutyrate dehydrogenase-like beta-hydroxyacid dehydrogenase